MNKQSLIKDFRSKYPFVGISECVVSEYMRLFRNHSVDGLYDYVMSQSQYDEVEL